MCDPRDSDSFLVDEPPLFYHAQILSYGSDLLIPQFSPGRTFELKTYSRIPRPGT